MFFYFIDRKREDQMVFSTGELKYGKESIKEGY